MIKRIYIDTSVFGGYFDAEFEASTKPFFERIQKEKIKIIISEILELELYKAPDQIIEFYESISEERIEKAEFVQDPVKLDKNFNFKLVL